MANTIKGRKFYVCATAQPADLNAAAFAALTWVEVKNVGTIGQSGTDTNVVNYPELATEVTQKQKGIANAGDPEVEVARSPTDAGQIIMRTIADTAYNYAFKVEDNDKPSAGYTNTIYYWRGIVAGPVRKNGGNEDFITETYKLGLSQKEVVVDPVPGSVPSNTTRPSISGTAVQTGVVLQAEEGVWTNTPITSYAYQWQQDTAGNGTYANLGGSSTSKTYTPLAGSVGNSLRVQVTATNGAGASSVANSLGTRLQAA